MVVAGYICRKCGLDVSDVQVRDRASGEEVVNYVHHVGRICGENHSIRSPMCHATAFDLKLPMSDRGVGFPGRQLTDEEGEDLARQFGLEKRNP